MRVPSLTSTLASTSSLSPLTLTCWTVTRSWSTLDVVQSLLDACRTAPCSCAVSAHPGPPRDPTTRRLTRADEPWSVHELEQETTHGSACWAAPALFDGAGEAGGLRCAGMCARQQEGGIDRIRLLRPTLPAHQYAMPLRRRRTQAGTSGCSSLLFSTLPAIPLVHHSSYRLAASHSDAQTVLLDGAILTSDQVTRWSVQERKLLRSTREFESRSKAGDTVLEPES